MRAASSPAALERRADGGGLLLHPAVRFRRRVCAPHGCPESRRETPCRRRRSATCRSRRATAPLRAPASAEAEHVVEAGDILAGDPVAPRRLPHGFEQADLRRLAHIVRVGRSEAAGRGEHDRLEHRRRVVHVHARRAPSPRFVAQIAAAISAAREQRRAEQDDAEIGVGRRPPARVARTASRMRRPTGRPGSVSGPDETLGAGQELLGGHAVPVGEDDGHCPASAPRSRAGRRLRRRPGCARAKAPCHEFAGEAKRYGRRGASAARSRQAFSRASAIASAMFTAATDCSPDQAGMLLTSSTSRLPSAAGTMSTPAKSAPTASAAATASAASSPSSCPRNRSGHRAAVDVGDPVVAAPAHHRHRLAGADEDAEIAERRTRRAAHSAGDNRRRSPPPPPAGRRARGSA